MNHFSQDFQQTLWWTPQPPLMEPNQSPLNSQFHRRPTTTTPFYNFNLNQHQDHDHDDHDHDEHTQLQFPLPTSKEALFEKPLTPSDVGKLNRLVIPKQHAERYFPLGNNNNNNEPGAEKGLLLNFEDEDGKSWRFRYSYWNSSQSYVLTKGWSRFVKDKRLDAGDVVLFERSRSDFDRLFIGWRRRNSSQSDGGGVPVVVGQVSSPVAANNNSNGVGGWTRVFYSAPSYPSHTSSTGPPPSVCMPYPQPQQQQLPPSSAPGCCLHAATGRGQTTASGNNKTLRLFGVNLECYQPDDDSEPSTPDGSTISSQGGQSQSQYHHYSTTSQTHHMEMDYSGYSGDISQLQQMRRSHHQS